MRISTNMSAYITANQLRISDSKTSKSLEKLSSGYKINNAGDNPAGSAISKKMRTQIRGLDRASQNASDGISVVQTAEGALSEIEAMVQRMRELSVQGATDTYTDEDRESIMSEIKQLETEINRISNDTEFNTRPLLNGDMMRDTISNRTDAYITYISSDVKAGIYEIEMTPGTKSVYEANSAVNTFTQDGTVKINSTVISIKAGDSYDTVYSKIVDAADKNDLEVEKNGTRVKLTSNRAGTNYPIEIEASSPELAQEFGLDGAKYTEGKNAEVSANDDAVGGSGFSSSAIFIADGNDVTVKSSGAFEMEFKVTDAMTGKGNRVQFRVLDSGTMTIQLGANEAQEMEIELPDVSCETLGLDKINARTSEGCAKAITICDKAISKINEARAKIGAYENRLDSAISSLDVTSENLSSALSRIEDVDMAKEMTEYTTQNVLLQAATSMLSQANQMPEKVLQLLQ